ncbi:MAG: L-threonylcarbamoyladenylate synthase [Candidatus Woesearchaeota archaeon]
MQAYNKSEWELKKEFVINRIHQGDVFVHPTDTIYGLGCDATNGDAIIRIRDMKSRYTRPFSVIAPNKTWIRENCVVEKNAVPWLTKLPGPYTLILKLKNKNAIAPEVNANIDTIGVRIIDHWSQELAEKSGKPIVTTSANKVGGNVMTTPEDIDLDIKGKIDFILHEELVKGKPSTIIDLTKDTETVTER